jgi:hypothetical protein
VEILHNNLSLKGLYEEQVKNSVKLKLLLSDTSDGYLDIFKSFSQVQREHEPRFFRSNIARRRKVCFTG